jgi:Putative binding domain, N-terminal/Viral BACON domain
VSFTTARECAWSAATDAPWLSINTPTTGQGDGSLDYAVAPNIDPATRKASIAVNDQHVDISQAAAECVSHLRDASAHLPPAGGAGNVDVESSSELCTWTASSEVDWITITAGATGKGNGHVTFTVAPTSGPPRTGTIVIAGQRYSVTQSQGCTYAVSPTRLNVGAAASTTTIAVTAAAGCPWTAGSNVDWIRVAQGTSGNGPGSISISIDANTGSAREGTLLIAGQIVTIAQAGPCTIGVSPLTQSVGAAGGASSVSVTASAGCGWAASSDVPWITITGGASGSGNGTVSFTVGASSGASRTGTLTVAGQKVTVAQEQGCLYSIAPDHQDIGANGGIGSVAVSAPGTCTWTAVSNVPWITITSGANGSGNGTVQFNVTPATAARSGTLTIAGQTFTVNQAQACSVSLSATTTEMASAGGSGTVSVSAGAGCGWSAVASVAWITITAGANGSGNGTVTFSVASNSGAARNGAISIGGQTFTVNQNAGASCAYSVAPASQNAAVGGSAGSITVTTSAANCTWTATSDASWLTITSGASGSGNGSVTFTASANAGPPRTATINVVNQAATIQQASGCGYTISPTSQSIGAGPSTGAVAVTTAATCSWTAASGASWLSITSGGSGTGAGSTNYSAVANTGPARTGTLTIAGLPFTVNQATGCTYSIAPTEATVRKQGERIEVEVTSASGCAWNATTPVSWIQIASGASGAGSGTVTLDVDRNTGGEESRTANVTIAGKTFRVTQEGK